MRTEAFVISLVVGLLACPAIADDHATFQSYWVQATANPNCKQAEYADFILVNCESDMTMWYFTKPNHPAHPGVIKRFIQQASDGSWVAHEEGHSFAPDSAQPAFEAWLSQIEDLDRKMREELKRESGAGSGKPN